MLRKIITLITLTAAVAGSLRAQDNPPTWKKGDKPALVVNIVVGGMRHDFIDRYRENLGSGGLALFAEQGMVFTESRYDFMQTNRASTLATFTAGCNPSVHGVIGEDWWDYTTGKMVRLIEDADAESLGAQVERGSYSQVNLIAPTLADELRNASPRSRAITIAADPVSAVAMGGLGSEVYWLDTRNVTWISSSKYMLYMPGWVLSVNEQNYSRRESLLGYRWTRSKSEISYVNSRFCIMDIPESVRFRKMPQMVDMQSEATRYGKILNTPVANDLVLEMARQAIIYENLGKDRHTDILNLCFDAPRNAMKLYGPESIEMEDMIYRVDRTIASLVEFLKSQYADDRVLYVLTSDHGSSDSYDMSLQPRQRFNGDQFRMILNSFLGAQFGGDDWVTGYSDRRLYLNRNAAYTRGRSLAEVQERAAGFALQFRGISHALTSSAMQGSTFSDAYLSKIQNGFYPGRSGDITINLMPGWIEERTGTRSAAGSLYDYDTHVPLVVMGCGLPHKVVEEPVDMSAVAPTLARILGISRPAASTAPVITELKEAF